MKMFILGLLIGGFFTYSLPILVDYHNLKEEVTLLDEKFDIYSNNLDIKIMKNAFYIENNSTKIERIDNTLKELKVDKIIRVIVKEENP